ncbi:threonine ammonia-lyase [Chitinophaga agri]|uniref:L-threonine dehydratase n=1 Tax=Chitinophaga agri TaxID=2703787 RepID=A0A6B9ZMP9_9BACT|nr:threonine ammonia-lyase [Chitinophaga agri]QHS62724.1 threonine ammonia-lyase [Chitinophaga agri]
MSQVLTSVNPLNILDAAVKLKPVVNRTPLTYSATLSRRYNADVYLKREDMQIVRSYKLRGAYNLISSLDKETLSKGVTCASAGNHAQGFAYACRQLDIKGVCFMPIITPKQKVNQVNMFGGDNIEIRLVGDTFDDCAAEAQAFTKAHNMTFIPPFDDAKIIEGQGTVAVEVLEDQAKIDYVFVPIGGGGLAAGLGTYFKTYSPLTQIIGVEPEGAPSMSRALEAGEPVTLNEIERFVDGAAVKRVGALTFSICKDVLAKMQLVPEGKVCSTILRLYNEDAIVVEPAGALSIAALDYYAKEIEGKKVVCVVSGSNNDIDRMQEIKERSLLYEGLKHYFIIRFVQRPGALKEFVNHVLGPNDDITRFEFIQKHNKETGPALIGVELKNREDYDILLANFRKYNIHFTELNKDDNLFGYLV